MKGLLTCCGVVVAVVAVVAIVKIARDNHHTEIPEREYEEI